MKLSKKLGGTGSMSYAISISSKEALSTGFLDENGESYDLEKIVNNMDGTLCIRRSLIEDGDKRVSRIFREYQEILLSGEPVIDVRNVIYWVDKDTLYEKIADGVSGKKAIAKIKDGNFFSN